MKANRTILETKEFQPLQVAQGSVADILVSQITAHHASKFDIEYPSLKTSGYYRITPRGWVGFLPIRADLAIRIEPKVPIRSVLAMLEFVYEIDHVFFIWDEMETSSIDDVFGSIANLLAARFITRARRGLYREYVGREEQLQRVRGRVKLRDRLTKPWEVAMTCQYDEHTSDVVHNQIIAWTLDLIRRIGFQNDLVVRNVHAALTRASSAAEITPFRGEDCNSVLYSRLNDDYRVMHRLCRFFLENTGPSEAAGECNSIPFVIEMDRLYERFVSAWLKRYLAKSLWLRSQVPLPVGGDYQFFADIVVYDRSTGVPVWVLDTKYKTPDRVDLADVAQVVAYAHALNAPNAALIYPAEPSIPLNANLRGIRVQTATFGLKADLDVEGKALLDALTLGSSASS